MVPSLKSAPMRARQPPTLSKLRSRPRQVVRYGQPLLVDQVTTTVQEDPADLEDLEDLEGPEAGDLEVSIADR